VEPGQVVPGQVEWGRAQWPREFPEWVARADLCLVDFRGVPRVALVLVVLDRGEWGPAGCVPVAWDRAAWDRAACVPVEWGQVVLGQVALGRVVARV
jgi:hypothetical protein